MTGHWGWLMAVTCLAVPRVLLGQAAVEYALQAARNTAATSRGMTIGGCAVDSELIWCVGQAYPRTTIVALVVIGVLVFRWMGRR